MKLDLQEEVAVVTGGSSGIGLAIARLLVASGARVYLVARNQTRLVDAAASLGDAARTIQADLSSADGANEIARALSEAGETRLDLLVNCAGQLEVGPHREHGAALAADLAALNYLGAVRAIDATLPLLERGRRRSIVNMSSLAGRMAPPYMAAYAGSKFALNGYTLALRQELRASGFHVALVSPGPVGTPMIEGRVHTGYYQLPPGIPIVTPERVARATVRLIARRRAECTVPGWLGPATRFGAAFPGTVDLVYRMVGWRSVRRMPQQSARTP